MRILGQITPKIRALYEKAASKTSDFDKGSRKKWNSNEEKSIGSMHQLLQNQYPPKVDESLLGRKIEYLSKFEFGNEKGGMG